MEPSGKNFVDIIPTPLTRFYLQLHPFYAENLTTVFLAIIILIVSWHERIFEKKRQTFQLLSKTRIVTLKSSSKWGVLLPNKKGKIRLIHEDSLEVATIHLVQGKNFELNREVWELGRLELLRADNPLSKVQTNIVTAVQQKLALQANLEQLAAHAQKAKDMYELIKGFESDPEIVQRYEDIYLQRLESISQLNISQALQDENIKRLLLFV
ncbi:hypothetical protein, partial [Chlorogloea sp. CCALA 695]|uniref:hypothetical protein n=1 Tax=Chlorogloea sp. CCALA 695 TaxID=2107693 RepID=UPI000D4B7D82